MANELICSRCGYDGTRCDCHRERPYFYRPSEEEITAKKIEENDIELLELKRKMGELNRPQKKQKRIQ